MAYIEKIIYYLVPKHMENVFSFLIYQCYLKGIIKLCQYFCADRILAVTPPVLCAESQTVRETIIRKAFI